MKKTQNTSFTASNFFRKQGNILEIAITGTSRKNLLMLIEKYFREISRKKPDLASKKPLFITTPNPEQLVMAYKDKMFRKIINGSDIALCDGIGLLAAYDLNRRLKKRKQKGGRSQRISKSVYVKFMYFLKSYFYILRHGRSSDGVKVIKGRDFLLDLLKISEKNSYRVFLLGSNEVVLKRVLHKFTILYPSVHFMIDAGAKLDSNSVPLNKNQKVIDKNAVKRINRFKPHFLFIAFGAPKQEKWVYRNIDNLKTDLIMVVGSSFDYIAGTRINVPEAVDRLGMEWLWRVITGSQNIKRISNAVIKFPLLVLKEN